MNASKWYRGGLALAVAGLATFLVAATGAAAPSRASAQPSIKSVMPHTGTVGTQVTITGNYLSGASVWFNGVPASVNVTSTGIDQNNFQIAATVPAGATTGYITVKANGGTARSRATFTVTPGSVAVARPVIANFSPKTAKPGSTVVIAGQNLGGASSIKVGGVKVKFFKSLSSTRLSVRVPSGATTGKISIVTLAGAGTSSAMLKIA